MRGLRFRLPLLAAMFSVALPLTAAAQNTTAGNAMNFLIGQESVGFFLSSTATERWYNLQPRAGRSYCVEIVPDSYQYTLVDPIVTIFQSDGTTVVTSNDDIATEPDANLLSRACWVNPSVGPAGLIRVTQYGTATAYYRIRIIETTLWSSWFFIGGDYNSFLLLRNTTDVAVTVTATWRSSAGAIVGTTTQVVPAHGGLGINARTYVSSPSTNYNGTLDLAHNGSPGAIQGQMSSLSPTTGLNFDSQLFSRPSH